ncbi:MAG: DUF7508 domain-containing protein [Rhodococcus sp. (in: high G+C Gram-positive bacteria)]|jgi:hypothetical protein
MSDVGGLGLKKAWQELNEVNIARLSGCLGVFEIATTDDEVVQIGYAGGRSLFGLRGCVGDVAAEHAGESLQFRTESNMQYISRWKELLMVHLAENDAMPSWNSPSDIDVIGRLGGRQKGQS